MPSTTRPIRRGKPVCFTLDHDAEALLRALVPNSRAIGRLMGELIRREARERVQRPRLLETLRGHHAEAGIGQER
jgi:hypothetical protein